MMEEELRRLDRAVSENTAAVETFKTVIEKGCERFDALLSELQEEPSELKKRLDEKFEKDTEELFRKLRENDRRRIEEENQNKKKKKKKKKNHVEKPVTAVDVRELVVR